jgi:hypothetical protein
MPVYMRLKTYPSYYRVDVPGIPSKKYKDLNQAVEYRDLAVQKKAEEENT